MSWAPVQKGCRITPDTFTQTKTVRFQYRMWQVADAGGNLWVASADVHWNFWIVSEIYKEQMAWYQQNDVAYNYVRIDQKKICSMMVKLAILYCETDSANLDYVKLVSRPSHIKKTFCEFLSIWMWKQFRQVFLYNIIFHATVCKWSKLCFFSFVCKSTISICWKYFTF